MQIEYRSSEDDENVRNVLLENFRLRHVDGAERLTYEGERQVVRVRLRRRLCKNKKNTNETDNTMCASLSMKKKKCEKYMETTTGCI